MTQPPTSPQAPSPQATAARRSRWAIALRLAAIGVVILATALLAHYLRQPSRLAGGPDGFGGPEGAWPPDAARSGSLPASDRPPAPDDPPTTETEARDDLRRAMAGLVIAAADDEAEFQEPENRDPEARRQFIADTFGVPEAGPDRQVPADLVPAGAQVLMVFETPERAAWRGENLEPVGSRMVLVRFRQNVDATLEAFWRLYEGAGWEGEQLKSPKDHPESQPDPGWLVRFRKGKRDRIVYARARQEGQETLAAVYEPRY